MTQALVDINGDIRDAATLTFPSTGRAFRAAWQLSGDVVEVDMVKAKDIKADSIAAKAQERAAKAELKAQEKAVKGLPTSEEDAEVAKFKSKPKAAGVALIQNAQTPEELDAITEDMVYG